MVPDTTAPPPTRAEGGAGANVGGREAQGDHSTELCHPQLDLWDDAPEPGFDGETFDEELDGPRLRGQLRRVYEVLADGEWRTLAETVTDAGEPRISEASASARIRDLRKSRFGSHKVERRRRTATLHEYRLEPEGDRV